MKVGIDCLDINPNYPGGVNSYLFGLMNGFYLNKSKDVDFIIFCCPANKHFFEPISKKYGFKLIIVKYYFKYVYILFQIIPFILNSKYLWKVFTNLYSYIFSVNKYFEKNCDIVYVASTVLNSYNIKLPTVLSMHDIQHVHFPHFFSKIRLRARFLRFENSALSATKIQASSDFIKNDLLTFFNFLKSKDIKVITEGVNPKEFSKRSKININKKYSLPEKYLFFPATLWKHKNHILVLKALKEIEIKYNTKIPLVLSGGKSTAYDSIMKYIKKNKMDYVKYLGKVSRDEIIALYQNSYYLVTAVLYESSSLPILEAAASGVPIIASNTPPNKEMSKTLKLNLFKSNDLKQLIELLYYSWNNSKIKSQKSYNLSNIKYYSWENIAKEYILYFKSILNE